MLLKVFTVKTAVSPNGVRCYPNCGSVYVAHVVYEAFVVALWVSISTYYRSQP